MRFLFKANLDEVVRATASGVQPEDQTESAPTSSARVECQKSSASSMFVRGAGAALREDMLEFDFERNFRGFLKEAPAMIFSVLPMALIGTGAASFRDWP